MKIDKYIKSQFSKKRIPLAIGIELTSRCNFNCSHCYINKPVNDKKAKSSELSFQEIDVLTDEALKLGTIWIQLTGGEPLLRDDFVDIYLSLKKKGFLVSVLTNGTLLSEKHIEIFRKYPPRNLELSIYGITKKTYESVTRTKESLASFQKGFNLCIENDFSVVLKTVASKSIIPEINRIKAFAGRYKSVVCKIEDYLIPRIGGDSKKPRQITALRLSENKEGSAFKGCKSSSPINTVSNDFNGNLFSCNGGMKSCWIGSDGMAYLCTTLRDPELAYDLRSGSLSDYWINKVPEILSLNSKNASYINGCGSCARRGQCQWCPALSWAETGRLDREVKSVCLIAPGK